MFSVHVLVWWWVCRCVLVVRCSCPFFLSLPLLAGFAVVDACVAVVVKDSHTPGPRVPASASLDSRIHIVCQYLPVSRSPNAVCCVLCLCAVCVLVLVYCACVLCLCLCVVFVCCVACFMLCACAVCCICVCVCVCVRARLTFQDRSARLGTHRRQGYGC